MGPPASLRRADYPALSSAEFIPAILTACTLEAQKYYVPQQCSIPSCAWLFRPKRCDQRPLCSAMRYDWSRRSIASTPAPPLRLPAVELRAHPIDEYGLTMLTAAYVSEGDDVAASAARVLAPLPRYQRPARCVAFDALPRPSPASCSGASSSRGSKRARHHDLSSAVDRRARTLNTPARMTGLPILRRTVRCAGSAYEHRKSRLSRIRLVTAGTIGLLAAWAHAQVPTPVRVVAFDGGWNLPV